MLTADQCYDVNQMLAELSDWIRKERFGSDRHGSVPPEAVEGVVREVSRAAISMILTVAPDGPAEAIASLNNGISA